VPPGSPCYVERSADRELLAALLEGTYCYVLNSRQMGKSSLAVRTIARLQEEGVRTAFVDLTRLGGATISAEQWYSGLLAETGRALGLRAEAAEFLRASRELGPAQRYLAFLHEVVLERLAEPVVVMIDEIDAVRSLPFSTDELFAGIRQLHNGRASDEALSRLTFCLLGAALPSDLIRDPRITPFNVGRRIELRDFTSQEAAPFADAIGGPERLAEVLKWTGGHPFLTQAICAELAVDPATSVTELVQRRYLDARARDTDTNLVDVGNRLLGRGDPSFTDDQRADVLSLFAQVRKRGIEDDESNPSSARIKMSGVARLEGGRLTIRNRIYDKVFGPDWIRENMPGQELRRQRKAFWKGALRTGAIALAVVAVTSTLALVAVRSEDRAKRAEIAARKQAYEAEMRTMDQWREAHNLQMINAALAKVQNDPWRGWEWKFWHRVANRQTHQLDLSQRSTAWLNPSPDGRLALSPNLDGVGIFDLTTFEKKFQIPFPNGISSGGVFSRDSERILLANVEGDIAVADTATGNILKSVRLPELHIIGEDGGRRRAVVVLDNPNRLGHIEFDTLNVSLAPLEHQVELVSIQGIPTKGGKFLLGSGRSGGPPTTLSVRDFNTLRSLKEIPIGDPIRSASLTEDGRRAAVGTFGGYLYIVDTVTGEKSKALKPLPTILFVSISDDGRRLVASGRTRECILYEVYGLRLAEKQRFRESNAAGILPNGSMVYTGYFLARFYDLREQPEVPTYRTHIGRTFWGQGTITPDGEVITWTEERSHRLNVTRTGSVPVPGPVLNRCDSRGKYGALITRSGDETRVIDVRTGEVVKTLPYRIHAWDANAFDSSLTDRIATLSKTNQLHLFPARGGEPGWKVEFRAIISSCRFSPDGGLLAVSTFDGSVHLVDASDGTMRWSTSTHRLAHAHMSFSPDGKRLAAVGHSDGGQVFDTASGRVLSELVGHSQSVYQVDWSPDGRRLATASDDGTVRLWDPQTGADLGIIGRHEAGVYGCRFLEGGRSLVSFSADGVVKLWLTENRL
jgi:WD40 repeat protein